MKQHIDSIQLKELSFEQVNKLGKMSGLVSYPWTNEEWEKNIQAEHLTMYISLLEWINIGRMIEILSSESMILYIRNTEIDTEVKDEKSSVILENIFYSKKFDSDELCDSLWGAVKYVLKMYKIDSQ